MKIEIIEGTSNGPGWKPTRPSEKRFWVRYGKRPPVCCAGGNIEHLYYDLVRMLGKAGKHIRPIIDAEKTPRGPNRRLGL